MTQDVATPRPREFVLLGVLACAGLALFLATYTDVQPSTRLALSTDRSDALAIAVSYLAKQGLMPARFTDRTVYFRSDSRRKAFTQIQHAGTTTLLDRAAPPDCWVIELRDPNRRESVEAKVSAEGVLFSFAHTLPSEAPGAHLSQEEARSLARQRLAGEHGIDWARYELVDAQRFRRPNRTDYTFTWQHTDAVVAGARLRLSATMTGDQLSGWDYTVLLPASFEARHDRQRLFYDALTVARIAIPNLLFVLALILFALRFRERELGLRNGLVIMILSFLTYGLISVVTFAYWRHSFQEGSSPLGLGYQLVVLGIAVLFFGLLMFTGWAGGESIAREVWPEKLKTTDGLFAGRLLFPELGCSLCRGVALGLVLLGLWYGAAWLLTRYGLSTPVISSQEERLLSGFVPFGLTLLDAGTSALLTATLGPLLALSTFRRWLRRTAPAVVLAVPVYAVFFEPCTLFAGWWHVALMLVTGTLCLLFFLWYDLLTVLTTVFVATAVPRVLLFLSQPAAPYYLEGILSLTAVCSVLLLGYVAWKRGRPLDEAAVQPRYVRHITERERLKMELEIARRAQLRMLPRTIPRIEGLDIAAFCEPAREVGGDYYDFFPHPNGRLGFAVGDVSGKGMPAALYMTLLKGFLQARAEADQSPSLLLRHVNRKFFESAERNIFATLLYGVIDLQHRRLVAARAGHLPIIIHRPENQSTYVLRPPGIGIGLNQGTLFDRIIREEQFALQSGDLVVCYTDGLVEARNAEGNHLDDEYVLELIRTAPPETAHAVLEHIRAGYRRFVERQDAHDDLTCVVVRIC